MEDQIQPLFVQKRGHHDIANRYKATAARYIKATDKSTNSSCHEHRPYWIRHYAPVSPVNVSRTRTRKGGVFYSTDNLSSSIKPTSLTVFMHHYTAYRTVPEIRSTGSSQLHSSNLLFLFQVLTRLIQVCGTLVGKFSDVQQKYMVTDILNSTPFWRSNFTENFLTLLFSNENSFWPA